MPIFLVRWKSVCLLLAAMSLPTHADKYSAKLWEADAAAGGALYGSQCMVCHGNAGNSIVPEQPILAGQSPEYLVEQILQFRNGERTSAVMLPFVQNLSDDDIYNIASWLGGQKGGLSGAGNKILATAGEAIYRKGIPAKGVPNCTGCHGPAGKGIPPSYPRLSGQHSAYTIKTLSELRDGTRFNNVMNAIATGLSDDEIAALAEYISGLY